METIKTLKARQAYVLKTFLVLTDDICTRYAESKMDKDTDLVVGRKGLKDLDVLFLYGLKKYSIKKSSVSKFEDYYFKKLVSIIDKMIDRE